ncbi:MAG TPA: hypothetical protein VND96_20155 [Candidatus Micrarchaeaceae archaeon]|nr:hypothetical protein [Candidatus Micrarchaeaceae archaeon]
MSRRVSRRAPRPINWGRLVVAISVLHFGLAAFVLLACEVVIPAVGNSAQPSPSGINYGSLFDSNFFRPFGWWVAGALVVLAPVNLLFRAADVWADHLAGWVRGR